MVINVWNNVKLGSVPTQGELVSVCVRAGIGLIRWHKKLDYLKNLPLERWRVYGQRWRCRWNDHFSRIYLTTAMSGHPQNENFMGTAGCPPLILILPTWNFSDRKFIWIIYFNVIIIFKNFYHRSSFVVFEQVCWRIFMIHGEALDANPCFETCKKNALCDSAIFYSFASGQDDPSRSYKITCQIPWCKLMELISFQYGFFFCMFTGLAFSI